MYVQSIEIHSSISLASAICPQCMNAPRDSDAWCKSKIFLYLSI